MGKRKDNGSVAADGAALAAKAHHLIDADQLDQAAILLDDAIRREPNNAAAIRTLAQVHIRNDAPIGALKAFDRLISRGMANAADFLSTGDLLTEVGEEAQAIDSYRRSLDLRPDQAKAHHHLARALYRIGHTDEAAGHLIECGRLSDAIDPWLGLATIIPGCSQANQSKIREIRSTFATRLANSADVFGGTQRPSVFRSATSRLRIGYLSAFFHRPNYMKPVWGLINAHQREAFRVHLFSDSPAGKPWIGYQPHGADRCHEIERLDNLSLGALIRDQGIDILVDLNGYSEPRRLGLFIGHCAPVVMAWFNMYATSGLPGVDYIVGDNWVVHPGEAGYYSEKILKLPQSYLTFSPDPDAPPVVDPPSCRDAQGLTFGSLVSAYKITPMVMDDWAEILRRTKSTRLLLANPSLKSKWNREYIRDQFGERGIDPQRLILQGPKEHHDYLRYYDQMDLALDAHPYNGGTTTMEALWQGVPVLTYSGDRWAARTSCSLLVQSPTSRYITRDRRDMIDTAVTLAMDPRAPLRLRQLRRQMRDRLERTTVCDAQALCDQMESLYRNVTATIVKRD